MNVWHLEDSLNLWYFWWPTNSPSQNWLQHLSWLQHVTTRCNTLHNNASQCNTLQHTVTHCNAGDSVIQLALVCDRVIVCDIDTLQHTATHCNTLQHTATHCNTLQHTATHCNTLQHRGQRNSTSPRVRPRHCMWHRPRKNSNGAAQCVRLMYIYICTYIIDMYI